MTLYPEQVKAKEYLHQKGTLLPVAQIRERKKAEYERAGAKRILSERQRG